MGVRTDKLIKYLRISQFMSYNIKLFAKVTLLKTIKLKKRGSVLFYLEEGVLGLSKIDILLPIRRGDTNYQFNVSQPISHSCLY